MSNIDELREVMEERVEEVISLYEKVKPSQLGLDNRAAYELFVDECYIACHNSDRRSLDYYGGFEYVESSYVFTMGSYTFYSYEDSRVQDHLDIYLNEETA